MTEIPDILETPIVLFEATPDTKIVLPESTHADPDHMVPGLRPYENEQDYFNRWLSNAREAGVTVWCRIIMLDSLEVEGVSDGHYVEKEYVILIPKDPIRHALGDNIKFPLDLTKAITERGIEIEGNCIINEYDPHELEYAAKGYFRVLAAPETVSNKDT